MKKKHLIIVGTIIIEKIIAPKIGKYKKDEEMAQTEKYSIVNTEETQQIELEKEKAGYQKEVTALKGEIAEILRDTELDPIEKSKEILPLHKEIAGLNKEIGRVSTKIEKYKRVIFIVWETGSNGF